MNCAKHKPYIALGKHVYTIQHIKLYTLIMLVLVAC